jgi:hypothetical protein
MKKITLGATYTDIITGFTGVATGRCEYISGCDQALLTPRSENGKPADGAWFDVQRLEHASSVKVIKLDNSKTPGFDKPAPIR